MSQAIDQQPRPLRVSIAVLANNQIAHRIYVSKKDGVSRDFDCREQYQIGSITKILTADTIFSLLRERDLDLDTPISQILGEALDTRGRGITIQELLTHTSGLPRMPASFFLSDYDKYDPYADFDSLALDRALGNEMILDSNRLGEFSYSNFGYAVLERVVEELTGDSFNRAIRNHLSEIAPRLYISVDQPTNSNSLAEGHAADGTHPVLWKLNAFSSAGGVYASSCDLAAYARWVLLSRRPQFQSQISKFVERDAQLDQSLGWMILKSKSGKRYPFHAGMTGGYSSIHIMDPDQNMAVAVLMNREFFDNTVETIGFGIMKDIATTRKSK
ncbi:MAG: serine hydrolase domain-containing protein [Pseudomonadota bacterium]